MIGRIRHPNIVALLGYCYSACSLAPQYSLYDYGYCDYGFCAGPTDANTGPTRNFDSCQNSTFGIGDVIWSGGGAAEGVGEGGNGSSVFLVFEAPIGGRLSHHLSDDQLAASLHWRRR